MPGSPDTVHHSELDHIVFTPRLLESFEAVARVSKLSYAEKKALSNQTIDLYMAAAADPAEKAK